jgi:hypothetical protein
MGDVGLAQADQSVVMMMMMMMMMRSERFPARGCRLNERATGSVTGPRLLVHPRYESAGWLMVQARAYWVGVR